MLSKIEKKLMDVVEVKIEGVKFGIKKLTPEDFLDREGIPISKWQSVADAYVTKQVEGSVTLPEMQKLWMKLFEKAVISIDGNEEVSPLFEKLIGNMNLSGKLFAAISRHCLGLKKNKIRDFFHQLFV